MNFKTKKFLDYDGSFLFTTIPTIHHYSLIHLSRAQSQGIELLRIQLLLMKQDPTLYDEKWIKGSARLVQLRLLLLLELPE